MAMCIIFGMGMPVAAAYILTAMLAAPILINMGVSTMAAHLFIVYFSIISAITPPVAVGAFAAAGIADANPTKVGFLAVRLGLAAFIVPFTFVYTPALLMEGSVWEISLVIISSTIGVIVLAGGIIGYFYHQHANFLFRIHLIIAGVLMVIPGITTDLIGLATVVLILLFQRKKRKQFWISLRKYLLNMY